jgi:ribosomal protein S27AE
VVFFLEQGAGRIDPGAVPATNSLIFPKAQQVAEAAIVGDDGYQRVDGFAMNDKPKPAEEMTCPVCDGRGTIVGQHSKITWYDCGYCHGTSKVSEQRHRRWLNREDESALLAPRRQN